MARSAGSTVPVGVAAPPDWSLCRAVDQRRSPVATRGQVHRQFAWARHAASTATPVASDTAFQVPCDIDRPKERERGRNSRAPADLGIRAGGRPDVMQVMKAFHNAEVSHHAPGDRSLWCLWPRCGARRPGFQAGAGDPGR